MARRYDLKLDPDQPHAIGANGKVDCYVVIDTLAQGDARIVWPEDRSDGVCHLRAEAVAKMRELNGN